MVEVTDVPDIVRIQAIIAESISLHLYNVDNVAQRAIKLYNRLQDTQFLLILDNVREELKLEEIGIPRNKCKLLLTTRERRVCKDMGVQDIDILEVGLMNTYEAKELFKSHIGNQVDVGEHKDVAHRMLSRCGGLPLAIVATTDLLKDTDLGSWKKVADNMEMPISSQTIGDCCHLYSILNMTTKFIKVDDKGMFFLLACLCPLGSSISIETLMRYGIGLGLFQRVNKLCQAMEKAHEWANELVSSSMLLEGDVKGHVKVHIVVRANAILYAATGGHKFLVDAIPAWMEEDIFKEYTAMSLMYRDANFGNVKPGSPQILLLKGDLSPSFTDSFFQGMENLKVLELSHMNFRPCSLDSLGSLGKLRTLSLWRCKLGDIKIIGGLRNLLVLSLRDSFVEELPSEIGDLDKLRLLDLSGCMSNTVPFIPAGVLGRLSLLEGLYCLFNDKLADFRWDFTRAAENNQRSELNVLEIKVAEKEEFPINAEFIRRLDKFRVCIGNKVIDGGSLDPFCRILELNGIDNIREVLKKGAPKALLKEADCLRIKSGKIFENLVPQLHQQGFSMLRSLRVQDCDDVKYVVEVHGSNGLIAFPCLRSIVLSNLMNFVMVCNGKGQPRMFSNLQILKLTSLEKLQYVLPLDLLPSNLNQIQVSSCKSLNFVFIENEVTNVIQLSSLKSLKLNDLQRLLIMIGPKNFYNTSNALQGPQVFFNEKIVFPSLEVFEMVGCDEVIKLWSENIDTSGFRDLKEINIEKCQSLKSVGSSRVFSALEKLETLSITYCEQLCEVMAQEIEICEPTITFPQLKYMHLGDMDNLQCFYKGDSELKFPKLKELRLCNLGQMTRFASSENLPTLFHEKIDCPCLVKLDVTNINDEVTRLWDLQPMREEQESSTLNPEETTILDPAPMLRRLSLCSASGLRKIPSGILNNLHSLKLDAFENVDVLFSTSSREGILWTYSELPKLKELIISGLGSLKELFKDTDAVATDTVENSITEDSREEGAQYLNELHMSAPTPERIATPEFSMMSFCGQLERLELNRLQKLKMLQLDVFKGLASLTISGLTWEFVISANVLSDSLQQLEFLSVDKCEKLKEIIFINVDFTVELPRLKVLKLHSLDSLTNFSSNPRRMEATLRFPSLESISVKNCRELKTFWSGKPPAKLRKVILHECNSMQCFFGGNVNRRGNLELPSFENVSIADCRNLQSFSDTSLFAPLTHILYEGKQHSIMSFHDLNDFLHNQNR